MFSIKVIESGGEHEHELCRVKTKPRLIVKALMAKRRWLSKDKTKAIPLYQSVRAVRLSGGDR